MRYSFVADHFQYLASIGLIVLFAAGVRWLITSDRALRLIGGAVLAVLMTLTWRHSQVYDDGETLWRDTIRKNPSATIAHNNLGLILLNQRQLISAERSFYRAHRLEPRALEPYLNLAAVAEQHGNLDAATHWLNEAHEIRPDAPEPRKHLARIAELKRQRAAPP
jgi:Tfp pilus assembly protein PilF